MSATSTTHAKLAKKEAEKDAPDGAAGGKPKKKKFTAVDVGANMLEARDDQLAGVDVALTMLEAMFDDIANPKTGLVSGHELDACGFSIMARAGVNLARASEDRSFGFEQKCAIPSYLLALAVGELEARSVGPRSQVWSEPSMVAAAEHEFAETEKFIAAAEAITGQPYVWGRYDILCLPPSFPSFVSPPLGFPSSLCVRFSLPLPSTPRSPSLRDLLLGSPD